MEQANPLTDLEKEQVERRVAETILERGVRVPIPAPRFLRLFGKKQIHVTIKQPFLRTLHTASILALKEGFSFDDINSDNLDAANTLIVKHAPSCARWVAINILNNRLKNRLFAGILGRWLMNHLTQSRLLDLVKLIVLLNGYQDFTGTIRLIRSMKMTTPRNLSPPSQGSQEEKQ